MHTRPDGKTVLSLTVRGTDELRNWIMSFGPHIKVLKPETLQGELRELHLSAARLYSAPG
jgi:predicted DNA-binding transcriptional regulator YafY